ATGTIVARGTIGPSMTAAFIAISRWTIAAGRTFAPYATWAFVGIAAWTVVTAIPPPTATAFFSITIPGAIALTRWRTHFITVIISRTETVVTWRTIETSIG